MILEQVASGAFSVTYRARHEELGRTVLIKTLKPTVSISSPFSHALEREAKILAGLRHDAILTLHELTRAEGTIWLVLEDARGVPLAQVIERAGKIAAPSAIAITIEVARGLAHAHERGVIHRELRPDVIALTPEGGVKITELTFASAGRLPSIPEPFEGSLAPPDSMAPEQILGESVTPRTDIFALGVVLYEMLAGARPFSVAGGDRKEIAQRIRQGSPEPLSALLPDVPRSLERAVMRCLARDPDDRFDSARAFSSALEEILASLSRSPSRVLVSRALAAAKLGDEILLPGADLPADRPSLTASPPLSPALRGYLLLLALIVSGALVIELGVRERDGAAAPPAAPGEVTPAAGATSSRGYLRVLATPWAEVLIDGEVVDTTPIGRPIAVSPGRHFITFRHPNAPDEKRSILVASGHTAVVDVTMRVDRGAYQDAGAGPRPDADNSP